MRNSNETKKSNALSISIKLFVFIACLFGFSAAGVGVYGICEKENYDGCYNYKLSLLKDAHEKGLQKAVFVGGSATNFGIRADYFEQQTGLRSINMGFSAGRSFDAYLNAIMAYMDPSDKLFLLPEPGYWGGNFHKIDSETVLFQQHNAPSSIQIQSPGDAWNLITNWIGNGWQGWANSFKVLSKKIAIDGLHLGSWTIYDKWECNSNGDFTLTFPDSKKDFVPSKINFPERSQFAADLGAYVRKHFQGIDAYIVCVPHDEGTEVQIQQSDTAYVSYSRTSGIPCLLLPSEAVFEHTCFLDTQFHLQSEFAFQFTEQLLRAFLSETSK